MRSFVHTEGECDGCGQDATCVRALKPLCRDCFALNERLEREAQVLAGVMCAPDGWRIVLRGEVILTTEDEGYALRALKRTIERELVEVRT